MAKVIGIIKLRGTIDDITFRDTQEGNIASRKTGPTREKVLYDPDFDQTRRYAGEFKLAAKDAKLLRHALGSSLDGVQRTTLNGHVIGLLYAAAQQDNTHEIGYRYAATGSVGMFEGFDFGKQGLDAALPVRFKHGMDAASGSMQVEIPSFIARKRKGFPAGATHFRIVSGGATINFEEGTYVNDIKTSALLPLRKQTPEAICLEHSVVAGAGEVMVQVLGIQFYAIENGREVLVKGGAVQLLAAERMRVALPVAVNMPQEEENAAPFKSKNLRWLGDPRRRFGRKGKKNEAQEESFELRATSCEQKTTGNGQRDDGGCELLAARDEVGTILVDGPVKAYPDGMGEEEVAPMNDLAEVCPHEVDELLDSLMTEGPLAEVEEAPVGFLFACNFATLGAG